MQSTKSTNSNMNFSHSSYDHIPGVNDCIADYSSNAGTDSNSNICLSWSLHILYYAGLHACINVGEPILLPMSSVIALFISNTLTTT